MLYVIMIFMIKSIFGYVLSALFLAAVILLSKISPKYFIKSVKSITTLLIFTAVINLFFTNGNVIFEIGIIKITDSGVKIAVETAVRLIFLITASSILTATASPIEITDAFEMLLKPLNRFGIPVHDIAMMMSIALRFIPTLCEEMQKIKKAQMSRGVDFENGSVIQRIKAVVPIIVPLFVASFRHADGLALAMESRCYRGGEGRTRFKKPILKKSDYIAAFISIFAVMLMVVL